MQKMPFLAATAISATLAAAAGAVVIDGDLESDYGPILFTQDTPTGFGDNLNPAADRSTSGSEIDGVYATVFGGNLNILVTGNLESNFNKLFLFLDTGSGGQNTLVADDGDDTTPAVNPDSDFGILQQLGGLTFDDGFDADYFVNYRTGNDPIESFINVGALGAGPGSDVFDGGAGVTRTLSNGVVATIDQSNVAGVTDTTTAGADLVTTGFEIAIPLSELGNPSTVDITGFVTGGDFLSNQVIGGVGGAANLGAGSGVDFGTIDGAQFVSVVVPEPATAGLLAVGGLTLLRRRSR